MDDEAFLAAFEDATLPRAEWTHAAHLRMAFLYLAPTLGEPGRRRDASDTPLDRIRDGIRRYNAAHGNAHGYHETITVAFARCVADRLRRDPVAAVSFEAFRAAHADLFAADYLLRHYSEPLLKSPAARAAFVAPDREPLPTHPDEISKTSPRKF